MATKMLINEFKKGDIVTVINAPDVPHWLGLTGEVMYADNWGVDIKDSNGVMHGPLHLSRFVKPTTPVQDWLQR